MAGSSGRPVSLPGLVRWRAERQADGVAITLAETGARTTWGDLHERAVRWAAMLRAVGVERGDVVATMLGRGDHAAVSWVGTAGTGALEAPLNHAFRGEWLLRVIATVAPAAVVCEERFVGVWEPLLADLGIPVVVVGGRAPDGFLDGARVLEEVSPGSALLEGAEDDPACIILTSGTTGRSKGVVVPWGRCEGTILLGEALDPDADGTYYNPFPTFHWSARGPIYRGAARGTAQVTRDGWKTGAWLADVREHGCTDTLLIGAMMGFLMASPEREDDADNPVRACLAGPVPGFVEDFAARFGIGRVLATYGMSEIPNVFLTSPGETVTARSCTSVGRPVGYPVRLVDPQGEVVPQGEVGELQVGGPRERLNLGYRNDPEATAAAWTEDGWFRTGDLFRVDDEGRYYFVDRLKDTLRRRGENISSSEVEHAAVLHPSVAECAVVAVPSEWSEDDVMIFVVLAPGAELSPADLIAHMADNVPRFAVPRYVEFVEDLPKTPSMKVQKAVLRDRGTGRDTWDAQAAVAPSGRVTA